MAMLFASAPRILNVATRRETIGVAMAAVVATVALTFGPRFVSRPAAPVEQGWTGHLAAAAQSGGAPVEPMKSSSLVVPKSALTLPPTMPKPPAHTKNTCDSADRLCVVRSVAVIAVPPKRQVVAMEPQGAFLPPALIPPPPKGREQKTDQNAKGFSLNPLNHVPDMSAIGRPFAAAGQAVSGWIKWL